MSVWKQIWGHMTRKKSMTKKTLKSKKVINTVYGNEKAGEQAKRFNFVHNNIKYRLVTPALLIFEKYFKKRIKQPDLTKPHFEYIDIYNKAFDNASIKWDYHYLQKLSPKNKQGMKAAKEMVEKRLSAHKWLQLLKDVSIALFTNDDAYMEWMTFFEWELYKELRERFKDRKDHRV